MVETVRLYLPVSPVRLRADEGIGPYAGGRFLPLNLARPMLLGVPSTPVPGCARSTLSKQERALFPRREEAPAGGSLPLRGRWQGVSPDG